MSDAIARRESRRRRILQNSESRLSRITGQTLEDSTKEDYVDVSENRLTSKTANEKHHYSVREEEKIDDFEQYELPELQGNPGHLQQKSFREEKATASKDTMMINSNKVPWFSVILLHKSYLYVLLAALINVLLLNNIDASLNQSFIFIPFGILAMTRWCLEKKCQEFQKQNNMLMVALILCNVKPEIVHTFRKIWMWCSVVSTDVAIYLTSFVVLNWILSVSSLTEKKLLIYQ